MAILSKLLQYPQRIVDGVGMYRTVTLALIGLMLCSLIAGAIGQLAYSPMTQLLALVPAVVLALGLNVLISKLSGIHANHESALITALILFFLVIPESALLENWALYAAVAIAVVSKFVIVYRKQHIFNAAALGAAALSLPGWYEFSWWVATPVLVVPVLVLGGLVVMKVRKWTPVLWFVGVGLAVFLFEGWRLGFSLQEEFVTYFLSWPTLFLAFFMLTEPFTMPPTKRTQALYGGFVGGISNTTVFAPLFYMTPELALLLGNLVAYPFRIRRKLFLKLQEMREVAADTYEFIFTKPAGFAFAAGQYLEWMLPHENPDSRGIRRYFTIASSPTESDVRLALKVPENASTYKQTLQKLSSEKMIVASQLAGDFLLPSDPKEKLGFIAGGIGVTPFRSHIRYMADSEEDRDVKLLYCVNFVNELAYREEFAAAASLLPLEVIPVVSKGEVAEGMEQGYVTAEMLERRVADYKERTWYISGPPPMVDAYKALLKTVGVPSKQIKTDFFPGVA